MKIKAEAINITLDTEQLHAVERKISRIENFFNLIHEVRVILKSDDSSPVRSRIAELRIHIPNGIIFIKESSKTFDAALGKAIVALRLQLLKYKSKRLNYCFT